MSEIENTVVEKTVINEIAKCDGFQTSINEQLFTYFPFQLLEFNEYSFVIENKRFHDSKCYKNNYVYTKNTASVSVNVECFNLKYNTTLKKICERAVLSS